MADEFAFNEQDMAQAKGCDVLGPAYFAARRCAEHVMSGVEIEPLKTVAQKCAETMRESIYAYVEDWMRSDLEQNLQDYIYRMVDDTVNALLTGEEWAMKRYPYHAYGDGEKVRAAVAKHGGDTLLMKRIEDLEAANERLTESLKYAYQR